MCFSLYKNCELKVKLWWKNECIFCTVYYVRRKFLCVFSQCIVYWISTRFSFERNFVEGEIESVGFLETWTCGYIRSRKNFAMIYKFSGQFSQSHPSLYWILQQHFWVLGSYAKTKWSDIPGRSEETRKQNQKSKCEGQRN